MPNVGQIGSDDCIAMPFCGQGDSGVNHVLRSTDATELTGSTGAFIIEWLYLNRRRGQQAGEPCLLPSVSPHLSKSGRKGNLTVKRVPSASDEVHQLGQVTELITNALLPETAATAATDQRWVQLRNDPRFRKLAELT